MTSIFLSAGESSGDHYGADLIEHLRQRRPDASFFGLCGAQMTAAQCEPIVRAETVAHMGITEVVRHAPHIYSQFRKLKQAITVRKPALAVLIDFPDVNFRLAKHCHAMGVPVLWLVSPQLWAWKKRRIRWVQRWVTKMLVIFPFEEQFYRERGVDAEFIGHPLADLPMPATTRGQFAQQHSLDANRQWIALLPGSRAREFGLHFPTMRQAATLLGAHYQFIVPIANTLDFARYSAMVRDAGFTPTDDARAAMLHARASIVASGTATVQAALMGNPFVIVYKMSTLSYRVARALVTVRFAGMPNLIAGRQIVPELLQADFTPRNVVETLRPLLADSPQRQQMLLALQDLRRTLTTRTQALPNAASNAENEIAMARAASAALLLLPR